jgi:HK97 family phage major capsid protein
MNEKERNLREQRAAHFQTMTKIMEKMDKGESLTAEEGLDFDNANRGMQYAEAGLKAMGADPDASPGASAADISAADGRGLAGSNVTRTDVPEIQGIPGEKLVPGQSMVEYVRRAAENGVATQSEDKAPRKLVFHDQDYLNEYWGYRFGFNKFESRVLAQDTGGSGQAITPQAWTANVVEFLYAASVVGNLGATRVPMPTEIYNVPVQTAPVQPAWLAENATIGVDANPAFGTIPLNAKGGWKDITTYSVELAQDAYIQGTLPGFLAESCGRNMALAVDAAAIQGVAGNAGNPD